MKKTKGFFQICKRLPRSIFFLLLQLHIRFHLNLFSLLSDKSISVFLPVRKGSERVPFKNTRPFAGIKEGLLGLKLQQLISLKEVDEIVVSSNDEKCIDIAKSFQQDDRIKIDLRPGHLCTSETDLRDLIIYCANVCSHQHILWTHVTSPFFDAKNYGLAIENYRKINSGLFDSMLTGKSYKEFLLDPETNKIVNNKTKLSWPRTQDLQDLFEINNALFMASKELFSEGKRVGERPFYMPSKKIVSIDIDDMDDFNLAEIIYGNISK